MSNFAERLVARSAGQPLGTGLSMLTPRPVSRFEPIVQIDVEATPESLDAPIGHAPDAQIGPAAAQTKIELGNQSEPAERTEIVDSARDESIRTPRREMEAPHPTQPRDLARRRSPDTGELPLRRTEIAETRSVSRVLTTADPMVPDVRPRSVHTDMELENWDEDRVPPTVVERNVDAPAGRIERDAAVPAARAPAASETATADEAAQRPGPLITIGKIDVQFLPQEPPAPVSRPQPQRTHGFDAYARARRGEPR